MLINFNNKNFTFTGNIVTPNTKTLALMTLHVKRKAAYVGALSGLGQFLATENPLKIMKNAFYFTSKALFVVKVFKCLPWPFGHVGKRLDHRDRFIWSFMTSQPG